MVGVALAAGVAAFPPVALGDAADLRRGAALYEEHCAACHGADLEGEPDWQTPKPDSTLPAPPHDDSGHTWHHPDSMLFDYTKLGGAETLRRMGVTGVESGMPGFADILSDDEIRAILDFLKSRWSPRMRDYQRDRTRDNERS
ncbi:MAG: cytochrome c [Pseudomonadota bacterium]